MNCDNEIIRFTEFRLHARQGALFRGDERIELAPQPLRLLHLLASRRGELVTHDEIRAHLWPDRVVDYERGTHFCVAQIRTALGERGSDAQLVVTVPGRGYRLAVDVVVERETRGARRTPAAAVGKGGRARSWLGGAPAALAVALLLIVGSTVGSGPVSLVFLETQAASGAELDPAALESIDAALRAELNRAAGIRIVEDPSEAAWRLRAELARSAAAGVRLDLDARSTVRGMQAEAVFEASTVEDADLAAAVVLEVQALVEAPVRSDSFEVESTITRGE